jgi:hypothetical protein
VGDRGIPVGGERAFMLEAVPPPAAVPGLSGRDRSLWRKMMGSVLRLELRLHREVWPPWPSLRCDIRFDGSQEYVVAEVPGQH